MYFATVVWPTSMPSLRSSPWMRGAPHSGSITKHLNAAGIRPRDGGRWGLGAVHKVLTRTTYMGRDRFNTKLWKTRERKAEVVEMAVQPIIEAAECDGQTLLKTRSPALTAPPTLAAVIPE